MDRWDARSAKYKKKKNIKIKSGPLHVISPHNSARLVCRHWLWAVTNSVLDSSGHNVYTNVRENRSTCWNVGFLGVSYLYCWTGVQTVQGSWVICNTCTNQHTEFNARPNVVKFVTRERRARKSIRRENGRMAGEGQREQEEGSSCCGQLLLALPWNPLLPLNHTPSSNLTPPPLHSKVTRTGDFLAKCLLCIKQSTFRGQVEVSWRILYNFLLWAK